MKTFIFFFLIAFMILLQYGDMYTTNKNIEKYGLELELNPMMRELLGVIPITTFFLKLLIGAIVGMKLASNMLYEDNKKTKHIAYVVYCIISIIYTFTIYSNYLNYS